MTYIYSGTVTRRYLCMPLVLFLITSTRRYIDLLRVAGVEGLNPVHSITEMEIKILTCTGAFFIPPKRVYITIEKRALKRSSYISSAEFPPLRFSS